MENHDTPKTTNSPVPIDGPSLSERIKRHREFKAGIISYRNYSMTVDCLVRDRSETGVKLSVEQGHLIPDRFNLSIPMDGCHVDCEVRWRKDRFIGAHFVGPVEKDARNARKQSMDVKLVVPQKHSLLRKQTV